MLFCQGSVATIPVGNNKKTWNREMAEKTKIAWATHSFNPWLGCSRVHAGCQNCYAEAMAGRLGVVWGPNGTRRRTAASTWRQVERWNRQAAFPDNPVCAQCGADISARPSQCPECTYGCDWSRPRVFPSLCDPFEMWSGVIRDSKGLTMHTPDGQQYLTMDDVRRDLFALIDRTPNLDWLLLTKRPENIRRMWPGISCTQCGKPQDYDGSGLCSWRACCETGSCDGRQVFRRRKNCWLLYSASDQKSLEAGLPHLLACCDLSPVLGLSLEPLVGPVDLTKVRFPHGETENVLDCRVSEFAKRCGIDKLAGVDWVIVGGESGPKHRPMCPFWLRDIADQCEAAGVPLFVKQDCGPKAGQQGRIPERLWAVKQFPKGA